MSTLNTTLSDLFDGTDLGAIKENACIPLLTKLADAEQVLDEAGYALFKKELLRNAVYESTAAIKAGCPMVNEYRSPLVIICDCLIHGLLNS